MTFRCTEQETAFKFDPVLELLSTSPSFLPVLFLSSSPDQESPESSTPCEEAACVAVAGAC